MRPAARWCRVLVISVLFALVSSCKVQQPQASTVKDVGSTFSGCACNDSACWNSAIRSYQFSAAICGLTTFLTALGGVGVQVPVILQCIVNAGGDLNTIAGRVSSCGSLGNNPNVNDVVGCLTGNEAMTNAVVNCAGSAVDPAVSIVLGIVGCGGTVLQGSALTIGQTGCLVSDVSNLIASNQAVEQQRQNFMSQPSPQGSAAPTATSEGTCNGEPTSCALWGMRRVGIDLWQQNTLWFSSRSYFCAQNCSNGGGGGSGGYCGTNQGRIFGDSDAAGCNAICTKAQCRAAQEQCMSYCCNQDGSCASSAHTYADQNNWW